MATITHIIHSHYDPADRGKLERETGQLTDNQSDPWQTESSFSAQRRIRAAPTFVPATVTYDEWSVPLCTPSPTAAPKNPQPPSTSIAEWYRSLTASSASRAVTPPPRPSSAPNPHPQATRPPHEPRGEGTAKHDWFVRNALRSAPSAKPSSPTPSLADLLARDPPPLPSEGRYVPPVWLHIGPSNRGFGMLQRSGWSEGEGLGAHVIRRRVDQCASSSVRVEAGVADVRNTPEVIDLTLSDSDAPGDYDFMGGSVQTHAPYTEKASGSQSLQRTLLTPLPTVLKADRLGIGLKAKTEGPYKQSKKRVTHSAAALAAHIRSAEEMRRDRAMTGRGKRGFAKIHRREEDRRKAMLAYLNE